MQSALLGILSWHPTVSLVSFASWVAGMGEIYADFSRKV